MNIKSTRNNITIPFSAFAEWLAMGNAFTDEHWRPVYAQCPCSFYNFIGHIETMDDDIRYSIDRKEMLFLIDKVFNAAPILSKE